MYTVTFAAIGTRWVLDIFTETSAGVYAELDAQVHVLIDEFDKAFSRFRQDSLVTQMAHQGGEFLLPDAGVEMLQLYQQLYTLTKGAFTPLIGSVLVEAGYDSTYSLQPKKLHRPQKMDEVLVIAGRKILLKEPTLLDFGAIGKGKIIDIIGLFLEEQGVKHYCIDAGGDIRYRGTKQLRVGLEHPDNLQQVIGVAKLKNESIAASSGNRRRWGKYHHIINPQTLTSPDHILATWVVAETAMLADGLATALFLSEPEQLTQTFPFSYLVLRNDYTIEMSDDFPAELYYN